MHTRDRNICVCKRNNIYIVYHTLNITFNKEITPNYVCTLINEDSRKIILSNVDNPNIIIEMILIYYNMGYTFILH